MFSSYDNWKLACCGNYPNCNPCPYCREEAEEEKYSDMEIKVWNDNELIFYGIASDFLSENDEDEDVEEALSDLYYNSNKSVTLFGNFADEFIIEKLF